MKKTVNLTGMKDIHYVYRIASVSMDRVTLEKHFVDLNNSTLDGGTQIVNYVINEDTKVGTVTQKMKDKLIPIMSKMVDSVVIDFKMEDKKGISDVMVEGRNEWIDSMIRVEQIEALKKIDERVEKEKPHFADSYPFT